MTKNNKNSWAANMKKLMDELYLGHYWDSNSPIPMDIIKLMVREKCKDELAAAVDERPKLRTYKLLYRGLIPAKHVKCSIHRSARSLVSQLRCGTLHLRLEVGRFNREPLEERICPICDMNEIETEHHFIFVCPAYADERKEFDESLSGRFDDLTFYELFNYPFALGKFVRKIWAKRSFLLTH